MNVFMRPHTQIHARQRENSCSETFKKKKHVFLFTLQEGEREEREHLAASEASTEPCLARMLLGKYPVITIFFPVYF